MAKKKQTKPKAKELRENKPLLSFIEVQRIAAKLAAHLDHEHEDIGLLILLLNHLERSGDDLEGQVFDIKKELFKGTIAFEESQNHFEAAAWTNRQQLLRWPDEQKTAQ